MVTALSGWAGLLFPATPGAKRGSAGRRCRVLDCADGESAGHRSRVAIFGHGERRRLYAAVIGPGVVVLAVDAGALVVSCPWFKWPKAIRKFNIVGVRKSIKSGQRRRKSGGRQASRPREGDFHPPPSPRWSTDARSFAGTS